MFGRHSAVNSRNDQRREEVRRETETFGIFIAFRITACRRIFVRWEERLQDY